MSANLPTVSDRNKPAYDRLTEKQQAFVDAMILTGGQNQTRCARMAGYEGSDEYVRVAAYRLAHHPVVLEAIRDIASQRITANVLLGAEVLVSIASDPTHKDRLKAAQALMDRGGMIVTTKHEVTVREDPGTAAAKIAHIKELAGRLGLDARALLGNAGVDKEVIDAEFSDVTEVMDDPSTWSV